MSESETLTRPKPFSRDFVVLTTLKHIKRSIDISISKTFDRVKDFDSNPEKSAEVMKTLSDLHEMRRGIEAHEQLISKGRL
jgi:predicted component of type VI protein secretion system